MSSKKFFIYLAAAMLALVLVAVIPLVTVFMDKTPYNTDTSELTAASGIDEPLTFADPEEEMRGLWIATVNNINFPSKTGLSEKELRAELDKIVSFADKNGFNTIMFQARPASDALYDSKIFPASKFVSGTAGVSPDGGFDCLAYILEAAHKKQIKLYAWVNPLRVTSGNTKFPQTDLSLLPESSPARQNPDYVKAFADGKLYFNAGVPKVRTLVADGVREICKNYAVDGVIFDDYFYPYPVSGAEFDDGAEFAAYGGDFADRGDFRRDCINKLVEECYTAVKETDKNIRFGVAPFGIWQNFDGTNGGSATNGMSSYSAIYCDTVAWVKGGYVDFVAPQLYWSFDTENAPYGELCDWWSRQLDSSGVDLYICHGVHRYDSGKAESGELLRQVEYARELYSYRGGMYYGYAALEKNSGNVMEEVKKAFAEKYYYYDFAENNGELTLMGASNKDTVYVPTLEVFGQSNTAKPININGIVPLRKKDGSYRLKLALREGANCIAVQNGDEKIEIFVNYKVKE